MIYVDKLVKLMGLKVKKLIMIYCDNNGTVALVNGWSVGGRTKHINNRLNFLRELKEANEI